MPVERFSTDPFPLDQRRSAWAEALAGVGLGVAAGGEAAPPDGRLLRYGGDPQGTRFVLLVAGPQPLLRVSRGGGDRAWLATLLDGAARLEDGAAVRPQDLLYWPSAEGGLLTPQGRARLLLASLPRRDPRWGALWESEEDGEGPAVRAAPQPVLAALLGTVAEAMEAGAQGALGALEVAVAEIMPAALGAMAGGLGPKGAAPRAAALRRRILRAIEQRLADPTLNLERFAEAEGVSVRAVQKLLAAEGRSFSQHLRHRRLERSAEALGDPAQAAVAVAEIAFRWGFDDPTHFSRTFRGQYGVAPNVFRMTALARGQTPLPEGPRSRGHPQPRSPREALHPPPLPQRPAANAGAPAHHSLGATPTTVHWGYFSRDLPPVLTVSSGDTVTVETLTQHASDDAARMIAGDADAEAVFEWTHDRKAIDRRGAGPMDASVYGRGAGEGFGVHILTGPIRVAEARPGDILEIEFLDIQPRPSQAPAFAGRCFGSNAAVWWGRQYDDLLAPPRPREVVTLYEISPGGGHPYAHAVGSFRWTPQRDPAGVVHPTIDYPGVPVDPATIDMRHEVLRGVRIPLRLHFGTIGLATDHPGLLDSIPPSAFGGNIDNWRLGKGSKLFLPVSVAGAMLSLGDPHAAQGDGEVSGTAIECSLTGTLRLRVHAQETAGPMLRDLNYPLIETAESWIVQGFSHPDYLADLGDGAQSEVYNRSSLDAAMRDAFRKARRFLMTTQSLTEDDAISLLSVAVDFGITQVVDGNWGVHAIIAKAMFGHGKATAELD